MGVLHIISFLPPSAGNKCKNHPSRHGSIALPVPKVPKMSMGAICFTSSGSNGGCWVFLVPPLCVCVSVCVCDAKWFQP